VGQGQFPAKLNPAPIKNPAMEPKIIIGFIRSTGL
jgi:hypothetical protein